MLVQCKVLHTGINSPNYTYTTTGSTLALVHPGQRPWSHCRWFSAGTWLIGSQKGEEKDRNNYEGTEKNRKCHYTTI